MTSEQDHPEPSPAEGAEVRPDTADWVGPAGTCSP